MIDFLLFRLLELWQVSKHNVSSCILSLLHYLPLDTVFIFHPYSISLRRILRWYLILFYPKMKIREMLPNFKSSTMITAWNDFILGYFFVLHVCPDNMIWYQSINSILHVINTNTDFNHQVEKMIVFLSYYFALEIEYWPTWTRGWWFEVVQSVRILFNLCRVLLGSVKEIRRFGFCNQGLNNVQEIV